MSRNGRSLELLFIVVKSHEQLDMVLAGFLEMGITGATVFHGRGMAQVLRRDLPVFAGLADLFPGATSDSHTIISVLDADKCDMASSLVEDVCGDFQEPGSGILFSLPVGRVRGLAEEIH